MAVDMEKSDLRIVKTVKVLYAAMSALLERNNFRKITVWDICETAQVSRATFYARYDDKYDFLKSWLKNFKPEGFDKDDAYERKEKLLNDFIYKNKSVIHNLVCDADNETVGILCAFVLSVFHVGDGYNGGETNTGQVVLSNFFAGGMIYYFQWQARNKFPQNIMPVNKYLREIIREFQEWIPEANSN
jgi:hypothetical protein